MTIYTPKTKLNALSKNSNNKTIHEFRLYPRMEMKHTRAYVKKRSLLSKYISMEIVDLSKGGLGIECGNKFEVGDKIEVKLGRKKIHGSVVYMKQILGKRHYKIGIKFEQDLGISDMFYVGASAEYAFS